MRKLSNTLMRGGATFALASALALGCAQIAFADVSVQGTDYYGNGEVTEKIDVLSVEGLSQNKVYVQVQMNGHTIADRLEAMTDNSQGGSTADGTQRGGVVSLDIDGLNLDGSVTYTVKAFADRDETDLLYEGTIYGVYAVLDNGTEKLIGAHTGASDAIAYKPAEKMYVNGTSYELESSTPAIKGTKIAYSYKSYVEAETATGTITYVDVKGNIIDTTTVPGVSSSESKTVDIPAVVTKDVDGTTYYFRTVFFRNSLTLTNPGQLNYTITCKLMGDSAQSQSGYYTARIKGTDQDGNSVFSDSVTVSGKYAYTLPDTIYKLVDGKTMTTYKLNGSSVLNFDAATDGVTTGSKDIDVTYTRQDNTTETTVRFNLVNGIKTAGESDRYITVNGKTYIEETVNASNPTASAPATITDDAGNKYTLTTSSLANSYTFASNAYPVMNVYYLPEGYTPSSNTRTITVNYVNFLTNKVIKSQSFTSGEQDNTDYTFTSEEKFSQDGVNYVRLDGQDAPIVHSYYSLIDTYTVYYRDVNDTLSSGTVINTMRVVYTDGSQGTAATGGTGTGTTAADGTQAGRLNADGTYNVLDGEGNNQTLTNEAGVDSNTERIDDNETPLASGADGGDATAAAESSTPWGLIAGGVLAALAAAGIIVFFVKRRNNDNNNRENA